MQGIGSQVLEVLDAPPQEVNTVVIYERRITDRFRTTFLMHWRNRTVYDEQLKIRKIDLGGVDFEKEPWSQTSLVITPP
jgi:hypothetical protein